MLFYQMPSGIHQQDQHRQECFLQDFQHQGLYLHEEVMLQVV